MRVDIVVTLCHILLGHEPACRDHVAFETDAIGIGCLFGEAKVIDWKNSSIYAGQQWVILGPPRCFPGGYKPREAT